MSWPRFMLNSWFCTFAAFVTYWHVAQVVNPQPQLPFFLWPCFWATWMTISFVWLGRLLVELFREQNAEIAERKATNEIWWEDYSREHIWKHLYDTHGFFANQPDKDVVTRVIQCTRCCQTRRIWAGCDVGQIKWGCAKIPLTWQLTHPVIPAWDVNTRPPWVR